MFQNSDTCCFNGNDIFFSLVALVSLKPNQIIFVLVWYVYDRFISSVELTKVMSDLGERLSEEEVTSDNQWYHHHDDQKTTSSYHPMMIIIIGITITITHYHNNPPHHHLDIWRPVLPPSSSSSASPKLSLTIIILLIIIFSLKKGDICQLLIPLSWSSSASP